MSQRRAHPKQPPRRVPGEHSWRELAVLSATRVRLGCRWCGVTVETGAAFPDTSRNERWNGAWMRRGETRPRCGGVS